MTERSAADLLADGFDAELGAYQLDAARSMSEADLHNVIMRLARLTGWLAYHTYDSRKSEPGFPDLILVKGETLLAVELKRQARKPNSSQQHWLAALGIVKQVEAYTWRPSDWLDGTIERRLRP